MIPTLLQSEDTHVVPPSGGLRMPFGSLVTLAQEIHSWTLTTPYPTD